MKRILILFIIMGALLVFGTSGYYLAVENDTSYNKLTYDGGVADDKLFPVILPMTPDKCYFRVRSFNTALITANSNIPIVM